MRIAQTFTVARPPEAVFDYVADPRHLRAWQTSKTRVDFVAEGETRGVMRLAGPIARRMMDRQFARYRDNLRRNVEALD